MSIGDLADGAQIKRALQAYEFYQKAVAADPLSLVAPEAKLPDAKVYHNTLTGAVIIIFPERHDSDVVAVQEGAESVAKQVLMLKGVKIAVEEPVALSSGMLVSNVGFSSDISNKPQSKTIFEFSKDAKGSIAHQISDRQISYILVGVKRFAAEDMPRNSKRYNNPEINKTMATNLSKNAGRGDIVVFPVGPDHLSKTYDLMTLGKHLKSMGWSSVAQN